MKKIVGLRELRENMDMYVSEIEKGRSFTVVRKSTPIFKMVPVDEWGDEGHWETILDFSKGKGGGMPIDKVIKLMEKSKYYYKNKR